MCDLYPSPTAPVLQHLVSYDDYESESNDYITASGLTITQLDSVPPEYSIRPETFIRGLHCELSMHDDLTFGYSHREGRISLVFSGIPDYALLFSVFYVVQSCFITSVLEGIGEVIFNAGKDDEIVYQDVCWMLQLNMSIIPAILDFVQTHYRTAYLND